MEKDSDIVAIWLKKDPKRLLAGALAGAFSGLLALGYASVLASMTGHEFWVAAKIVAVPLLGNSATTIGLSGTSLQAFVLGLLAFELLAVFLGVLFAHFTGTNSLPALLGMGLTWGAFSWIFINNLFSPSFLALRALNLPNGTAFFIWMIYGIALTSVAFFHRRLTR